MKTFGTLFLLVLAGMLVSGCDSAYGDRFVKHEVKSFHADFNEGKYSELYMAAAAEFHQQGPEKQFTDFLASVNAQLGKVVSSRNKSWDTRVDKNRREILLIQNTRFEKGLGVETFTYVLVDGKAVLMGYRIKPVDSFKTP